MDRRLTGQNATMPDVPLYVAAITAAAGVAGAAIPAIAVIIRDVRQAEHGRRTADTRGEHAAGLGRPDRRPTGGDPGVRRGRPSARGGRRVVSSREAGRACGRPGHGGESAGRGRGTGHRQAEYHDPPTGLLRARRKRRGLPADRCGRRRGIAYRRSSELSPTSFWADWRWWGGSGGSVALRARLASSWAAILSPPRASARAA